MDIPKLSGYVIDINKKEYNTFGKLNGENRNGLISYINIKKEVILQARDGGLYKTLEDAPRPTKEIDVYSGEVGDPRYEPIGYRIGDLKHSINAISFSNFTIGKNLNNYSTIIDSHPNQYGIIINPNGIPIKISINPLLSNSEDSDYIKNSKSFYENYQDILYELNQHYSLSIGQVYLEISRDISSSTSSICKIPGIENESIYKLLEQDPIKFINNFNSESNRDYQDLKKFILRMHSIFNLLNWDIDFIKHPALLFLISSIYTEINQQHRNYQGVSKRLEYIVSLPLHHDHHNTLGVPSNFNDTFKNNQLFQKPCLINLNIGNDLSSLNEIINEPSSSLLILLKSLLNKGDYNDIKEHCYLTTNINQEDVKSKQLINEEVVSKLSSIIVSNGFNGLLLNKDRENYYGSIKDEPNIPIPPPTTIEYDNSISKLYSKENQLKTSKFVDLLNNIHK